MSPLSPAPLIAFIWLKSTNKKTIFDYIFLTVKKEFNIAEVFTAEIRES
jgi:hypothetical protein